MKLRIIRKVFDHDANCQVDAEDGYVEVTDEVIDAIVARILEKLFETPIMMWCSAESAEKARKEQGTMFPVLTPEGED